MTAMDGASGNKQGSASRGQIRQCAIGELLSSEKFKNDSLPDLTPVLRFCYPRLAWPSGALWSQATVCHRQKSYAINTPNVNIL
jgi:hypothetical protein